LLEKFKVTFIFHFAYEFVLLLFLHQIMIQMTESVLCGFWERPSS